MAFASKIAARALSLAIETDRAKRRSPTPPSQGRKTFLFRVSNPSGCRGDGVRLVRSGICQPGLKWSAGLERRSNALFSVV